MDLRRRSDFVDKPSSFLQECEALGLFQTRMPRFPQLFFYDFPEAEVAGKQGQSPLGPSATQWLAMGRLISHTRLESKSGLSDVLYLYLEGTVGPLDRSQESAQGRRGQPPPPHPHLHPDYLWLFTWRLRWTGADEREISGTNNTEDDFWLEIGEGRKENRPENSLTRRLTLAAAVEGSDDYIPSSVPEERELRIPK